jgi:sec-independent protein translocase protein TatA
VRQLSINKGTNIDLLYLPLIEHHHCIIMRVFSIVQLSFMVAVAFSCFVTTTVMSFVPIATRLHTLKSEVTDCNATPILPTSAIRKNRSVQPFLQRQRRSFANVQMMGLFGLGAPEIAVIAIAAAFLLGPQKLAELGKDAGKIAGELKEVPKEFQAGLKEGEQSAQMAKLQETTSDSSTAAVIDATTTAATATVEEKKE